jgi:hypothetical protein
MQFLEANATPTSNSALPCAAAQGDEPRSLNPGTESQGDRSLRGSRRSGVPAGPSQGKVRGMSVSQGFAARPSANRLPRLRYERGEFVKG